MFTKFHKICTKFVIYAVLSQCQIVSIYAFFLPNLYSQKLRIENKIVFPTLKRICVGIQIVAAYWARNHFCF